MEYLCNPLTLLESKRCEVLSSIPFSPWQSIELKGPLSQPSGFTFQASGALYGLIGRCHESSDPLLLYRRMGQAFCRQYLVLSLKLALVASALVVWLFVNM